jgi:Trypsin-like peptidase domain
MSDFITAIAGARESVAAILRIHPKNSEKAEAGYEVSLAGSAFAVAADRLLLTAHHILNGGNPRDPADKFYALTVPGNGDEARVFPVVSFPLERSDCDLAALKLGPSAAPNALIPALPVSFASMPDGSRVVTIGFPAPEIASVALDRDGNYTSGRFFLKSHANEGIVSAQYDLAGAHIYELSVGWHHGESGGPIVALSDPPAAISLMQHYRNVQSPHGFVAGPHRGYALSVIRSELAALGVKA